MGVNYLGFNPFLEGPISLFQVSNGSCSDFSVIIVLKLLGLSAITLTHKIREVIHKFLRLLLKIHIFWRGKGGMGMEEICLKVRTQLSIQIAFHISITYSGDFNIPAYKGAKMGNMRTKSAGLGAK